MSMYYFITIKLTTYTILFIYSLELIIFAILYNLWPIVTRHGSEKQNYPAHLSQYLQTLNKSVVSYLIKILFRWLIRLPRLLKNNTNRIHTRIVKYQIKILVLILFLSAIG